MIRWVSRTSQEPRDGARVFTMTLSPFARAEECTLTPTLCWVGLRVRVLWLGPGWVRMFTVNPLSGMTW